jgi:hypothetical protein
MLLILDFCQFAWHNLGFCVCAKLSYETYKNDNFVGWKHATYYVNIYKTQKKKIFFFNSLFCSNSYHLYLKCADKNSKYHWGERERLQHNYCPEYNITSRI